MVQSKFMLELTPVSGFLTHYGIEWGSKAIISSDGSVPITLPISYTKAHLSVTQSANACYNVKVFPNGLSQLVLGTSSVSYIAVYWRSSGL